MKITTTMLEKVDQGEEIDLSLEEIGRQLKPYTDLAYKRPSKALKGEVIYVTGPFSNPQPGEVLKNVQSAIEDGIRLFRKGHYPVIPHLTYYVEMYLAQWGLENLTYENYLEWDMEILKRSDAVLEGQHSPGVLRELELARSLGKKIYKSVEEVPDVRLA